MSDSKFEVDEDGKLVESEEYDADFERELTFDERTS
jgi:hypothetical protein